ncbi:putative membrane protein, partial [Candidatus Methanophagaceae archaeon]
MTVKFENKEWFAFILAMLILTDLTILLDIPFLRQILGFLFLTILPGLVIIQILRLDKLGSTEKFVLSVGLSISFLMLFGLLVNNLALAIGYETPLATIPLLTLFNLVFIVLTIVGYKTNEKSVLSLPDLNLSTSDKAFLIVPILFPVLSIFGMHVMNTTANNIILILLFVLISVYVVSVCLFNQNFSERLYPVAIFSIGISLLLLMALRSNHLIGVDIHKEYYFFQTTWNNMHWSVLGYSTLNACLSISLLPTIYQSILNMNSEFLFRILYSLIFSAFPLAIYVLSKKYVSSSYAFLASCFSMFQVYFLTIELNPRTSLALLFFVLAIMTLFDDKIDPLKKRILFIVFMVSCMVSHYSTTYIFFFILLATFIGTEILSKQNTAKKVVSFTIVILFFGMIFLWYSQVTETAFNAGVGFIKNTLSNLNEFFVLESRSSAIASLIGRGSVQKGALYVLEFVLTWLSFAFIGIGIITVLRRYKEMVISEQSVKKPDFLKQKFEVEYLMIALACAGLLVIMVILPYISVKYSLMRLYAVTITILSVFFVIGGITISKHISSFTKHFLLEKEPVPRKQNSFGKVIHFKKRFVRKEKQKSFDKISNLQRNKGEKSSQAYFIILLVLIPYFLCVSDVAYNIAGVPR